MESCRHNRGGTCHPQRSHLDRINPTIAELTQAIQEEAEKCPPARRLMTHPAVGALTAVAFVLIIGEAHRFDCGKQIAAYLGLVPEEDSSGVYEVRDAVASFSIR